MKELKMGTVTVPESELMNVLEEYSVKLPEEIDLPFSYKLDDKHTLVIERRTSQRVTSTGLVNLINVRVHENMVNRVGRE